MSSVVTLYVVDYDNMVSGSINHSEGHRRGNIDVDVYFRLVSFNVGNVYSLLTRAGSSYSVLMAGPMCRREYSSVLCSGDCTVWWWICEVWRATCGQQQTDRIVLDGNLTAHRYINQVLRPVLLPFLQHQPRLLFQQDNAV